MKPAPADPPATGPAAGAGHDERLAAWLGASTDAEASQALAELIEQAAMPVLLRVVRRKPGAAGNPHEVEDIIGEARVQIIRRLQRLRETRAEPGARPLADFPAYVASVAATTWAGTLRRRHPARAALVDRLRYLLEGRTNQQGFALWVGAGGESWAGFEAWRERETFLAGAGPKPGRLLLDPGATAAEIFGADAGHASWPLPEVLAGLFAWLGEPLRLRDLTDVIARWEGLPTEGLEILTGDPALGEEYASAGPSPHDELRWKEYLHWLLCAAGRLTLRQRSAFLLHSSCLHEMERLGLTGIRHTASLLEVPPEQMAGYWPKIPLEDRGIAALLGLGTQQVINLRKVARGILGRAWQEILQGN